VVPFFGGTVYISIKRVCSICSKNVARDQKRSETSALDIFVQNVALLKTSKIRQISQNGLSVFAISLRTHITLHLQQNVARAKMLKLAENQ
jgi:hypothetical protein